ncbi:hypothetical protein SAMN05421736_11590 [Evansella caseinilytica]|uniref:Uncharacterized protein n=1 Tax=Evansella caseinilytica TaxID=1503961 RepID=A0A1H3TP59_9BACI|nr:hypothetical protein [Evansella caseinilytica]SDZ51425.1 hypothetical protein SAMN05421736_11590 [Evansella caseinilytica]
MDYVYEKRVKLAGSVNKGLLCVLNITDDWIHDQYGESYIHHGTIYSSTVPFHPQSTFITGYFQDDETEKWIKVTNGVAQLHSDSKDSGWRDRLEPFLAIEFMKEV